MSEMLEAVYDCFYTPPRMAETEAAIEANHRLLIERLGKAERKLVLRIIDDKNRITEAMSRDSFICGFRLAWRMANELDNYKDGRSTPTESVGLDARLVYREGERT